VQYVLIALALVIFWLVVMAPARRQQKKTASLQHDLQVGDEVVISAGIYGTVRDIQETKVTLEVAPGTVLTVARQVVVRRQEKPVDEPMDDSMDEPMDEPGLEHDEPRRTGTAGDGTPDAASGTED